MAGCFWEGYCVDALRAHAEGRGARTRARCTREVACGCGRAEDNHARAAPERVRSGGGCPPPLDNRAPERQANHVRACPPHPQALPPLRDLVSRGGSRTPTRVRISSQERCRPPRPAPRGRAIHPKVPPGDEWQAHGAQDWGAPCSTPVPRQPDRRGSSLAFAPPPTGPTLARGFFERDCSPSGGRKTIQPEDPRGRSRCETCGQRTLSTVVAVARCPSGVTARSRVLRNFAAAIDRIKVRWFAESPSCPLDRCCQVCTWTEPALVRCCLRLVTFDYSKLRRNLLTEATSLAIQVT